MLIAAKSTCENRIAAFIFIFLIFLLSSPASAQKEDAVIRVDTELASFEVTVADSSGHPVRNLKAG
ncbi:MAG TPA: hypothetical protein DEA22_03500, partial [Blastocatellia bacterium]|nr:hypothetical protein [Blastocatellia bacterium]